ncbi:MAG: AAA family ATPase, partial [Blastochloris sp.]|nr:AAA family ATPase [Blastochloris sp.]
MQCAAEAIPFERMPILCDSMTYEATRNRLAFEALPPLSVKGKAEPVAVYRPLGRELTTVRRRTAMVGREAERERLGQHVQRLQQGQTSILIIEGETGMGKSRLIGHLQQQAEPLDITCLVSLGDAVEQASSYHAWRPIVRQLFHLDMLPDDPLRRRSYVVERLRFDTEASRLLPLINAVLPLDMPENEITAQMVGQLRADNTRRLLVRILQLSASLTPLLIVLDEAHWLDSASWALALDVARQVRPLLLVVATRPANQPFASEYRQLFAQPDTHHMVLGSLADQETLQVICQALGVRSLPEQVARFIIDKSQGN